MTTPSVFIGIGSNIGDRIAFLRRSVDMLCAAEGISIAGCSAVYRTEPVGVRDQPEFLNAVVEIRSDIAAEELHQLLKRIEAELGRNTSVRWGPREIDLDLLYFGSSILLEGNLKVPHPEAANRRFVLVPLKEIAGAYVDPLRKLSIADLLAVCPDTSGVRKIDLPLQPQIKES